MVLADRQTQFRLREEKILDMAEQLLLESGDGDITLDILADSLDLAKGTLYKHFQSKDELFLRLVMRYEEELTRICNVNDGLSASIARVVLFQLLNPQKTVLLHQLEERLAASSHGLQRLFSELYQMRRIRMKRVLAVTTAYLDAKKSSLTTRDYLALVWSIGQGGAAMLNSSYYQRYIGRRDTLRLAMVQQVLDLPSQYPLNKMKLHHQNNSIHNPK